MGLEVVEINAVGVVGAGSDGAGGIAPKLGLANGTTAVVGADGMGGRVDEVATGAGLVKVESTGAAVADMILGGDVEILATGAEMVGVDGDTGINACGADIGLLPDPPSHNGCPRPVHAEQKLTKSPLQLTLPVGHPPPSQQVHSSKVAV
jgi:hypothetical protein